MFGGGGALWSKLTKDIKLQVHNYDLYSKQQKMLFLWNQQSVTINYSKLMTIWYIVLV